ncbi:MAG: pilus assembly protein [Alphaproteobacteria bacterium]
MTLNCYKSCKLIRLIRQFFSASRAGERGLAMIEFALVLPVLVMLFLGLVEFGEAYSASRKVTFAASTVSDLVAQMRSVTDTDLTDIALVADELIKPYRTSNFGVVITSVVADSENNTTVGWSFARGSGATAKTDGALVTLPAGLTEPGSSIIMVETFYEFTPSVGLFLLDTRTLTGKAYYRPRRTKVISREAS